ncbi:virulence factor [Flavobacterium aquariorum]|uniref:Virulence factor n=1 Tax=Flavobacterium aquariorum TaxID=2217670 RepID=A0A2W7TTK1_9FLAO|nr:AcvB/VirJ family lysyl-phosphatidylglycerol hydrolase [Flavobacterium aquariorum]PZX92736.1 virulence factor [Flavobacterium aquariorum]
MKNLIIALIIAFALNTKALANDVVNYGSFGNVAIYKPTGTPKAFVLFISGDGGWNQGVVDIAKNIANQGAMVAGVNILSYYRNTKKLNVKCYYPASDFENLSLEIQKRYHFPNYFKPILVGYSSGATLVYGALAQAPANTFKGAVVMGFCPDIKLDKTLCNGTALTTKVLKPGKSFYLNPSEKLTAPFIVLQGLKDLDCPFADAIKYGKEVNAEQLIGLPKVGHGFSVTKNWLPQFSTAYTKIQNTPTYAERKTIENKGNQPKNFQTYQTDLPLTIIHSDTKESLPLAFMISGDGGWTSFDQELGEQFSKNGIPVIGLDAQSYFWNAKTPQKSALDISNAINHYMKQWNKKSFILVGYSFGASVIPFIANNFPDELKEKIKGVYSLSPDETADFEIHLLDMISVHSIEKYNVIAEISRIKSLNPVCFFGNEESETVRKKFEAAESKVIVLPGNHHFDNGFGAIVENVLRVYNSIK